MSSMYVCSSGCLRCVLRTHQRECLDSLVPFALTWFTIPSDTMFFCRRTQRVCRCVCVFGRSSDQTPHNPLLPSFIYSPLTLHHFCLRVSSHLLLTPPPPPPPHTETHLSSLSTNLSLSIYPPFHCLCTCPSSPPALRLGFSNNIPGP